MAILPTRKRVEVRAARAGRTRPGIPVEPGDDMTKSKHGPAQRAGRRSRAAGTRRSVGYGPCERLLWSLRAGVRGTHAAASIAHERFRRDLRRAARPEYTGVASLCLHVHGARCWGHAGHGVRTTIWHVTCRYATVGTTRKRRRNPTKTEQQRRLLRYYTCRFTPSGYFVARCDNHAFDLQ